MTGLGTSCHGGSTAVLLQTMEREWKAMKRRYDHLAEFWQMVREEVA